MRVFVHFLPKFNGILSGKNMGRSSTTWTKETAPKGGRKKGATGVKTDLLFIFKKFYSEPVIQKDKNGNVIRKVKLSPEQQILASLVAMMKDPKTPVQVRARIAEDLMQYIYKKPAQDLEMIADVSSTINDRTRDIKKELDKLTPEERETYMELCGKVNDE